MFPVSWALIVFVLCVEELNCASSKLLKDFISKQPIELGNETDLFIQSQHYGYSWVQKYLGYLPISLDDVGASLK